MDQWRRKSAAKGTSDPGDVSAVLCSAKSAHPKYRLLTSCLKVVDDMGMFVVDGSKTPIRVLMLRMQDTMLMGLSDVGMESKSGISDARRPFEMAAIHRHDLLCCAPAKYLSCECQMISSLYICIVFSSQKA